MGWIDLAQDRNKWRTLVNLWNSWNLSRDVRSVRLTLYMQSLYKEQDRNGIVERSMRRKGSDQWQWFRNEDIALQPAYGYHTTPAKPCFSLNTDTTPPQPNRASAYIRIPHHPSQTVLQPAYGYHTTPAKPQRNTNTHRTRAIQPMK